jgi:hypothetical protein
MENGHPDAPVGKADSIYFYPAGIERNVFQAHELWRRLGCALAAPTTCVGWHSWMSVDSTGFRFMGLRTDLATDAANADQATPRLVYYAFQRFKRWLGDVKVGRALMRSPVVVLQFDRDPSPSPADASSGGGSGLPLADRYRYLIFNEPRTNPNRSTGLRVRPAEGTSVTVRTVPTILAGDPPVPTDPGDELTLPSTGPETYDEFILTTYALSAGTGVVSANLHIAPLDPPMLLSSPSPLTFGVVRTSA